MEFNEKLQSLRKAEGLTQEELAEAIYVSRTAVSKWESGRGYPNIDSLRELSRFFGVTVDELIRPDEIITAAEDEKRALIGGYTAFICGMLDALTAMLLFIPVFGNGSSDGQSRSLFGMSGTADWIKITYAAIIALTVLNGICGAVVSRLGRPLWDRHRVYTGFMLSIIATGIFIITRQPYAGAICFAILVVKGCIFAKKNGDKRRKNDER